MYEDLARTQTRSPLEDVVVRFVIPTILSSFVMQCRELAPRSSDGMQYLEYNCFGGDGMRALSSVASLSIHAALGAAFLFGTAKSAHTIPEIASPPVPWVFAPEHDVNTGSGTEIATPDIQIPGDLPTIPPPLGTPQTEALTRPILPTGWVPGDHSGGGELTGWSRVSETGPEVLAGPLPAYPDLLRQAGVEGQVVLEARVDTTGRVQRGSVVVVSATHPGFVEPARQGLLATLFRPARVNGRAVLMLVRVPFAFSLRGGTGHAR